MTPSRSFLSLGSAGSHLPSISRSALSRRRAPLPLLGDWPENLHPASVGDLPSAEDLDRADVLGRAGKNVCLIGHFGAGQTHQVQEGLMRALVRHYLGQRVVLRQLFLQPAGPAAGQARPLPEAREASSRSRSLLFLTAGLTRLLATVPRCRSTFPKTASSASMSRLLGLAPKSEYPSHDGERRARSRCRGKRGTAAGTGVHTVARAGG
jgi:hypothetical protein